MKGQQNIAKKQADKDRPAEANERPDANAVKDAHSSEAVEMPPDPIINPFWKMEKAFEKKTRNLKKREQKLLLLKADRDSDKPLTTDQYDALAKLDEVKLQIAFIEEMVKLNQQQLSQYRKACKQRDRKLRLEQKARTQNTTTAAHHPSSEGVTGKRDEGSLQQKGEIANEGATEIGGHKATSQGDDWNKPTVAGENKENSGWFAGTGSSDAWP